MKGMILGPLEYGWKSIEDGIFQLYDTNTFYLSPIYLTP
jgi:hypothetical protein